MIFILIVFELFLGHINPSPNYYCSCPKFKVYHLILLFIDSGVLGIESFFEFNNYFKIKIYIYIYHI